MKSLTILMLLLIGLNQPAFSVKPKKLIVSQDVFVQGGETANEAFGSTLPDKLRIMNSEESSKYARITYLQFYAKNLKDIESYTSVDLVIKSMVYESKTDPNAKFELQVYTCEDDKWKETKMTWDNKPSKGELLGDIEIAQSLDKNYTTTTIPLQLDAIKELIGDKKDGKISLVLYNENYTQIACEIISKERLWSDGMPTKSEAALLFK